MSREEKQRRSQVEKKVTESSQEHLYEVISAAVNPKPELRIERRRDKHGRRPHSAPSIDVEDEKRYNSRNRKPAPPPPEYQDPAIALLPKQQLPSTLTSSVLEVENNNKIILNVDSIKSPIDPVATNGTTPTESSTAGQVLTQLPIDSKLKSV